MTRLFKKWLRYIYWHLPLSDKAKYALREKIIFAAVKLPRKLYDSIKKPKFRPPFKLLPKNPNLPDIFIFAIIDWTFRFQRPQQLAKQLAKKGHRVFYCSNVFKENTAPGFSAEKLDEYLPLYKINLFYTKPFLIYDHVITDTEFKQLKKDFALLLKWCNYPKIVSIVNHPFWTPFAIALPNNILVYDCMDFHAGFNDESAHWPLASQENALLKKSDLVLVSSQKLYEKACAYNPCVSLIRNATDYAHFKNPPTLIYKDPHARKIIGYYGAIAEWFDGELIAKLAKTYPECLILLIGADTTNVEQSLSSFTNIIFTGEVDYAKLPYYLHSFDVCIIPFKINALTESTNPVKVYEYLSAGKPIVSVCLPELELLSDYVSIANSSEEFCDKVSHYLENPGNSLLRQKFAETQSWETRTEAFEEALQKITQPRVSIIILTYNNLKLTKACIESVQKHTDYSNYEVIIVDNASHDGTPEYLKTLPSNYKIVLNTENQGYAKGNNTGIKIAEGDYLVLLNNDTEVTPGWLTTFVNHFKQNEQIGLLGPTTNNIGNEAKISVTYRTSNTMLPEVQEITANAMGQLYPIHTLAFFCVMIPRNILEQVGLLDEQFGIGFFEDDDYCRRVASAGYKILCAHDIFVHHHLSASFNEMNGKERHALFEKNKFLYEKKWGPWMGHHYKSARES